MAKENTIPWKRCIQNLSNHHWSFDVWKTLKMYPSTDLTKGEPITASAWCSGYKLCKPNKGAYACLMCTSSTAQGGGGSFKNRKPIGEIGCCESGMAERSHWWIERRLISLTLSLTVYLPTYLSSYVSIYLSIYLAIYLSLSLFHLITLSIYLSSYLSIYRSIYLSLSLSLSSVYLSSCLPVYLFIYLSLFHRSICLAV